MVLGVHGDIVRRHNMDTQLYLSVNGRDPQSEQDAVTQLEECISDIKLRMLQNKLNSNDSETEFIQFCPSASRTTPRKSSMPTITIGDDVISPGGTAKNLGVLIDNHLTLMKHIISICKAANFQLYRLSQIRKYLTQAI